MIKNTSLTKTQLILILGFFSSFVIVGIATAFLYFNKETTIIVVTSTANAVTENNTSPSPTKIFSTSTLVPTFTYKPTFTPFPSPTSFVLPAGFVSTLTANQTQNNSAPSNPPSNSGASGCSAKLAYAEAMHQYYLDSIDYLYYPYISYYESLLEQAIRDRDAYGITYAQKGLDDVKAQIKAEKSAENKRYKAEKANINATCQ